MNSPKLVRYVTFSVMCITIAANLCFFVLHEKSNNPEATSTNVQPNLNEMVCFKQKELYNSISPGKASLILLNWKRLDNMKQIVTHSIRTPRYRSFLKEIIIWNNNFDVRLKHEDFISREDAHLVNVEDSSDDSTVELRIFNSPSNLYFLARYIACEMANTDICIFQDDDWRFWPMKSMYMNYIRFPDVLHTDTNAFVHYLSWEWTFFNPDIDMHTGFSWVGTGAIVSKKNVKDFFKQIDKMQLGPDTSIYADMYFSTWMNSVPYQLSNNLGELNQIGGFSSVKGGIQRNKDHMFYAARDMYNEMKRGNSKVFRMDDRFPTYDERDVRSPCFTDECLFITNMNSFPSLRHVKYDSNMNIDDVEAAHQKIYTHEFFVKYAYHHAVDNNIETSWKTSKVPSVGDAYGLDLFEKYMHRYIRVIVGHSNQEELELLVSSDAESWMSIKSNDYRITKTIQGDSVTTYLYDLHTPRKEAMQQSRYRVFQSFRFFKFQCTTQCPDYFQVYEIISFKDSIVEDLKSIDASIPPL